MGNQVEVFAGLGDFLKSLLFDPSHVDEKNSLLDRAYHSNAWFTPQNTEAALKGILNLLDREKLKIWTEKYPLPVKEPKVVGIVMAGNIPGVGFNDLLSVLISGHTAMIKPSSDDKVLIPFLINKLLEIDPSLKSRIRIAEKLQEMDAVIATGSNNTARYFEYYFSRYPHIIRKNRTSIAIINGDESEETLKELGKDVFSYFGLGCRNVSKIFIPENFDVTRLFPLWEDWSWIKNHSRYFNNYEYQKAIMLVNGTPFLDNGFFMLRESDTLFSPISVIFYEKYADKNELKNKTALISDQLQCIVGTEQPCNVLPGKAQSPELWDYADRVDTLEFLCRL